MTTFVPPPTMLDIRDEPFGGNQPYGQAAESANVRLFADAKRAAEQAGFRLTSRDVYVVSAPKADALEAEVAAAAMAADLTLVPTFPRAPADGAWRLAYEDGDGLLIVDAAAIGDPDRGAYVPINVMRASR